MKPHTLLREYLAVAGLNPAWAAETFGILIGWQIDVSEDRAAEGGAK
jgi:hypothetical protein